MPLINFMQALTEANVDQNTRARAAARVSVPAFNRKRIFPWRYDWTAETWDIQNYEP